MVELLRVSSCCHLMTIALIIHGCFSFGAQDVIDQCQKNSKEDKPKAINCCQVKALKNYLEACHPAEDELLFVSRKGNGALTTSAVNNLIKKWTNAINLRGNYGAHSLRKTWGYQQRIIYGVGVELICKRFNHSNPAVTMRYLGIEDKEIHNTLMNEIG